MPTVQELAARYNALEGEAAFREWYRPQALRSGLNPDPDAPEHYYDYRAAYKAGAEPDEQGHWPSKFKRPGHPRLVVDGANTQTGETVNQVLALAARYEALEPPVPQAEPTAPFGQAPDQAESSLAAMREPYSPGAAFPYPDYDRRPQYTEEEVRASVEARERERQERAIKLEEAGRILRGEEPTGVFGEGKRGIAETLRLKRWAALVPVGGALAEGLDTLRAYDDLRYLEDVASGSLPQPRPGEETALFSNAQRRSEDFLIRMAEKQARGRTKKAAIVEGVLDMFPYAGEFIMSGGVATTMRKGGRRLAIKALRKSAKGRAGKVAVRGVGWTAAGLGRASTTMAGRTVKAIAERKLGQPVLTEKGRILLQDSEGWFEATLKGYGDIVIEAMSEEAGAAIGKYGGRILKKIPGVSKLHGRLMTALGRVWKKSGKTEKFSSAFRKLGYHGVLQEMSEERLGDVMRALTGVQDFKLPSVEEILIEGGIFAVPGGARAALSAAAGRRRPSEPPVAPKPVRDIVAGLSDEQLTKVAHMDTMSRSAAKEIGLPALERTSVRQREAVIEAAKREGTRRGLAALERQDAAAEAKRQAPKPPVAAERPRGAPPVALKPERVAGQPAPAPEATPPVEKGVAPQQGMVGRTYGYTEASPYHNNEKGYGGKITGIEGNQYRVVDQSGRPFRVDPSEIKIVQEAPPKARKPLEAALKAREDVRAARRAAAVAQRGEPKFAEGARVVWRDPQTKAEMPGKVIATAPAESGKGWTIRVLLDAGGTVRDHETSRGFRPAKPLEGVKRPTGKGAWQKTGKVQFVKPGQLGKGIERNPAVGEAMQKIRKTGTVRPIEIAEDGFIVDGEHRYKALTELGVKDIPVYVGDQEGAAGRLKEPYPGTEVEVQVPPTPEEIKKKARKAVKPRKPLIGLERPKADKTKQLRAVVHNLDTLRNRVIEAMEAHPAGDTGQALKKLSDDILRDHALYQKAADTEKGEGLTATLRNASKAAQQLGKRMADIGAARPKILDPGKPLKQQTLTGAVRLVPAIPEVEMHSEAAQTEYDLLRKKARSAKTTDVAYKTALAKLKEMQDTGELPGQADLFEEAKAPAPPKKAAPKPEKVVEKEPQAELFQTKRQAGLFQPKTQVAKKVEKPEPIEPGPDIGVETLPYDKWVDYYEGFAGKFSFGEQVGKPLGIKHSHGEPLYWDGKKWVGEQGALDRDRWRRALVRQALKAGKTVPQDVLEDHPDLAPKAAAQKEVAAKLPRLDLPEDVAKAFREGWEAQTAEKNPYMISSPLSDAYLLGVHLKQTGETGRVHKSRGYTWAVGDKIYRVEGSEITETTPKEAITGKAEPEQAREAEPEAPGVRPGDIPYALAERAHSGTSMVPERRAESEQGEYVSHMNHVWETLVRPGDSDIAKEEFEKYRARWLSKYKDILRSRGGLMSTMITGPSGFPVARQRKKSDVHHGKLEAFLEWDKKAQRRLIETVHPHLKRAISSDDADAVELLQAKIDKAEGWQEVMKASNAILRRKKLTVEQKVAALVEKVKVSEEVARKMFKPDVMGRMGFPPYMLQNNLANIKRMKGRITDIGATRAAKPVAATFEGGRVEENPENNRIQIFFDKKPSEEVRTKLKARGFRWARREVAWQRKRTANARYAVEQLFGVKLKEAAAPEEPAGDVTLDEATGEISEGGVTLFTGLPVSEIHAMLATLRKKLADLRKDKRVGLVLPGHRLTRMRLGERAAVGKGRRTASQAREAERKALKADIAALEARLREFQGPRGNVLQAEIEHLRAVKAGREPATLPKTEVAALERATPTGLRRRVTEMGKSATPEMKLRRSEIGNAQKAQRDMKKKLEKSADWPKPAEERWPPLREIEDRKIAYGEGAPMSTEIEEALEGKSKNVKGYFTKLKKGETAGIHAIDDILGALGLEMSESQFLAKVIGAAEAEPKGKNFLAMLDLAVKREAQQMATEPDAPEEGELERAARQYDELQDQIEASADKLRAAFKGEMQSAMMASLDAAIARLQRKATRQVRAPVEQEEPDPSLTSIKNAQVDRELETMGLPPATHGERLSFEEAQAHAAAKMKADPLAGHKLVQSLAQNSRPVTGEEDALLLHEQVRLKNERIAAEEALADAAKLQDQDALREAEGRVNRARDDFQSLGDVVTKAGTANAIALGHRRMMMKDDYSLAAMERSRVAANKGQALTEKQAAEVKELHETIMAAEKALRDSLNKNAELQAQLALGRRRPRSTVYGARNRLVSIERAELVKASLRGKFSRMSVGLDPTMLAELAQLGLFHLEAGTREVGAWTDAMVKDLGEKARPHLGGIWKTAQTQWQPSRREEIVETGKLKVSEDEDVGTAARALAKSFIAEGIRDRGKILDAVHKALQEIVPGISRRETADAISGYGKYRQLSRDEIAVRLRAISGELQQISKLEDMAGGQAPRKTGVERRTPTDEERRLIRQVGEAKKRGGFAVTDRRGQLKTALDEVKTRLTHQIADLEAQLAARKPAVRAKVKITLDAEAVALKARRDALKQQYDDMFGKARELTDAQRLKMAVAGIERSIAEYERRIAENDLFPGHRASRVLSTPELEALRARREALRQELKTLQDIVNPKKTPEERALQAYRTRVTNRIAELKDRLARGDFLIPERKTLALGKTELKLKHELELVKRKWNTALWKDRQAHRSIPAKILGVVGEAMNTARAVMTSLDLSAVLRQGGFVAFGHPIRAARAFPAMFRALASERGQFAVEQEILNRENYPLYLRAGLYLSEHGQSLAKMEEVYMSRLAEKIPLVAASQRAYTTFLNRLRADSFDVMARTLGRDAEVGEKEAKAIANYVNVATGRGNLRARANASVVLNTVFFAPRYVASRFQLIAAQPIYGGTARTRRMIAKEYARFVIGLGVVYGLGALAGGEIEEDPRSASFGKMRFGDSRLDPLSGTSQVTVFAARVLSGKTKTGRGELAALRGPDVPYGRGDTAEVMARFLRSKLSPAFGLGVSLAAGEDYIGEPLTPVRAMRGVAVPLAMSDVYEALRDEGIPQGTALGLLALFGMGLQTYSIPPLRAKGRGFRRPAKASKRSDRRGFRKPKRKHLERRPGG